MLNTPPAPLAIFNLEGEVLGIDGSNPHKPRFIVLGVEEERVMIKLPKQLYNNSLISDLVQVGCRLACIGKTQIDHSTGLIKMTALQLFLPTLFKEYY